MEQIRYIADAIDEVVYYFSIAFSVYQGIMFMINSWGETARIQAEIEQREIDRKKWMAVLENIEEAESPNGEKKVVFTKEDMATTWL
jgi:hypothetical protein